MDIIGHRVLRDVVLRQFEVGFDSGVKAGIWPTEDVPGKKHNNEVPPTSIPDLQRCQLHNPFKSSASKHSEANRVDANGLWERQWRRRGEETDVCVIKRRGEMMMRRDVNLLCFPSSQACKSSDVAPPRASRE